MKYINCEYGFEGRPPYFKGFYERKNKGPKSEFFVFPEKGEAGLGLHYSAPNAVQLVGEKGTIWLAEISYQRTGRKRVTSSDFLENPGNFFAAGKDGRYTYFNHGSISASVVKYSGSKAVLMITGMGKVKVRLDFYPVEPNNAEMTQVSSDFAKGEAFARAVIPGTIKTNDYDMEIRDRYSVEFDSGDDKEKEYFFAKSYFPATSAARNDSKGSYMEFALDNKSSKVIVFLTAGGENIFREVPELDEIQHGTGTEELIYTAEKLMGSGELGKNAANAVSSCLLNRIYDPFKQAFVLVENRTKCNRYYSYDSTEMAIGSILYSLMGSYDDAVKQLDLCVTDEILGALSAWFAFCRTRNHKILEKALPRLLTARKIDGELVVADKLTLRELAYKQTGSPLKDIKNENVYSLDMSCYKLLHLDILLRMATVTKNKSLDAIVTAKEALRANINRTLYNPRLGLYMDRYVSGDFVGIYTANTFLPLVAGAVDNVEVLDKLLIHLKDPKEFGGEWAVPTLPRNNPLHNKLHLTKDSKQLEENGYRGKVSPLMNFLIYLGLKRYGVSSFEMDLSIKSALAYSEAFKKFGKIPAFFPSAESKLYSAPTVNYLSGNLMSFIGMMQMIDVEYFRDDLRPALCFGTLLEGDHRLANIELFGNKFSISISDEETRLVMNDTEILKGSGGKFLVRNFTENYAGTEFLIYAKEDITLELTLPVFTRGNETKSAVMFNVEKGRTKVTINRKHKVHLSSVTDF